MAIGVKKEDNNTNAGISLSEYVKGLQEDKQGYDAIEDETDLHLDNENESVNADIEIEHNPEQVDIVDTLGTAEIADFLVNTFNVGYNVFARAFSRGYIDTKEFEATKEELQSIRKPLTAYLKTKEIAMSPGTALLIAVLVVYAPKTFMLISAKKQAIKELKANNEAS